MGYSYHRNWKTGRYNLCCDICGNAENVRKYRCPFGYCSAIAACPKCRRAQEHKHLFSKKSHLEQGCELRHQEFVQHEQERADMIDREIPVRCSALSVGDKVHVLFRTKTGTVGFYMDPATYHAFPLLKNVSPDDFREYGELTPAPIEYSFGGTTKQVSFGEIAIP